jgi:sec-independent protein translocase protein TatC
MNEKVEKELTFWDHLDELRKILFRIIIVVVVIMIVAFLAKELLSDIILAPSKSDFVTYRLFCRFSEWISLPDICPDTFHVDLINTELPSQFLIHMSAAFYAGILLVFPYILYQIYRFVSPALYENERKYSSRIIFFSSLLFFIGVLLNYFLIFPLSFRFLATYQVSEEVKNMINITSYIDTLVMLSLMIGIMSELPIISWLFAKIGFLSAAFMKKYRRHAIVLILIIAAIITPTTDVFTLMLVFVPIYVLYELSIGVVKMTERKKREPEKVVEEGWENPYEI